MQPITTVSTSFSESGEVKREPLLELECMAIKMQFESRPRTNGMRFGVSVGGLYLKDKVTKNSIMTELVKPQMKVSVYGGTM